MTMDTESFVKAIEHEQSLIRRLFISRRKRSENIERITKARYGHLVGKFFKRECESETIYRIDDISAISNYVMSEQVDIVIKCSCLCTLENAFGNTFDLYIHKKSFKKEPLVNLDEYLSSLIVDKKEAVERFDKLVSQLKINLGL